jgi:hypothetical protein
MEKKPTKKGVAKKAAAKAPAKKSVVSGKNSKDLPANHLQAITEAYADAKKHLGKGFMTVKHGTAEVKILNKINKSIEHTGHSIQLADRPMGCVLNPLTGLCK